MTHVCRRRWTVLGVVLAVGLAATATRAQETVEPSQFVPLDPCRILDTRRSGDPIVTDTVIPAGSHGIRVFKVRGACGVPADPRKSVSLAYNLTAIGTFNNNPFAGHMLVFPPDIAPPPLASSINFPPRFTIANASIIRMNGCPDGPDTAHPCYPRRPGDIAIQLVLANGTDGTPSLGAAIHIALDVVGYFKR